MKIPLIERIESRLEKLPDGPGCWLWLGALNNKGYGVAGAGGRGEGLVLVHRAVYEHYRGAIASGFVLDHRCFTTSCANPWHLDQVTQAVNAGRVRRPETCPRGHSEWGSVPGRKPGQRSRYCKACNRDRAAALRAARASA